MDCVLLLALLCFLLHFSDRVLLEICLCVVCYLLRVVCRFSLVV